MQASEAVIHVCSTCRKPYLNATASAKCCADKKTKEEYRYQTFPGYSCGACGKLFFFEDKPHPGYMVYEERRADCQRDAEACCNNEEE